jgi:hypothetical protein
MECGGFSSALLKEPTSDRWPPDALKIPACRTEYSLAESVLSAVQAEPKHPRFTGTHKRPLTSQVDSQNREDLLCCEPELPAFP